MCPALHMEIKEQFVGLETELKCSYRLSHVPGHSSLIYGSVSKGFTILVFTKISTAVTSVSGCSNTKFYLSTGES